MAKLSHRDVDDCVQYVLLHTNAGTYGVERPVLVENVGGDYAVWEAATDRTYVLRDWDSLCACLGELARSDAWQRGDALPGYGYRAAMAGDPDIETDSGYWHLELKWTPDMPPVHMDFPSLGQAQAWARGFGREEASGCRLTIPRFIAYGDVPPDPQEPVRRRPAR